MNNETITIVYGQTIQYRDQVSNTYNLASIRIVPKKEFYASVKENILEALTDDPNAIENLVFITIVIPTSKSKLKNYLMPLDKLLKELEDPENSKLTQDLLDME